MRSTRRLFATLVLAAATPLAAQTTWTGAVSTNWHDNANWTAGIPDQNTPAVINPATRQPVLAGIAECRHLTVATGTALTVNSGATLGVYGDASFAASVLGTGFIKWYGDPGNPTPPPAQIVFTNQAHIPIAWLDDGLSATFTDLDAGSLWAASLQSVSPGPHLVLHGHTRLGSGSFFGTPQGLIDCDANGTLEVSGTLDLYWQMNLPGTVAIHLLQMWPTSSVTPSSGVIRIPTNQTLHIDSSSYGSTTMTVDVPAGATFQFYDGQPSSPNHIDFVQAAGSITVACADDDIIRFDRVDGDLYVAGSSQNSNPAVTEGPVLRSIAPGQPMVIGPTGSITYGVYWPSYLPALHVRGTLQVDGRLTTGNGAAFAVPQTLRLEDASPTDLAHLVIGSGAMLELTGGHSGWLSVLEGDGNHHATVEVHGTIAASWAAFRGLGHDGLQLLAGSTVAAAPQDLDNCVFDDGAPVAGSTLLTMARDAATQLDSCTFDASNSTATYAIRATSPHAVDVRNYSGTLGDEGHEDDPHGAISWTDGVSFLGAATPSCRGLAEQRANSEPHIGNGAFALTCANAVPGGPALQILGIGGLQAPTPVLGTGLWVDPGQPLVSPLVFAGAGGSLSYPRPLPNNAGLIGVALCAQALILEAPACMPPGLSASTAIRFTILP